MTDVVAPQAAVDARTVVATEQALATSILGSKWSSSLLDMTQ